MSGQIVVIGDAMIDRYVMCDPIGISSESPQATLAQRDRFDSPGGAANVARTLANLGHKVTLLCAMSADDDDEGTTALKDWFDKSQMPPVNVATFHVKGYRVPLKVRITSMDGVPVTRYDIEGKHKTFDEATLSGFTKRLKAILETEKVRCIVLVDYAKGLLTDPIFVGSLITWGRKHGVPIVVDPKHGPYNRFQGATLLTPNTEEALAALDNRENYKADDINDMQAIARKLLIQVGKTVEAVVVTAGFHGMILARQGDKDSVIVTRVPAYLPTLVFNPIGAGDVVTALMAHGIANTPEPKEIPGRLFGMARAAAVGASLAISRRGTGTIYKHEFVEVLSDQGILVPDKVVTLEEACSLSLMTKARGGRVIFTNGCFDLLHPGHIHALTTAKRLGELLIVGLNSDDSVTRLKGPMRPIVPFQHRKAALSALSCIDGIVAYDAETPEELVKQISPTILIKGREADLEQHPDKIPGARCVIDQGGEVVLVEKLPGYSTTTLLESFRKGRS